MKPKFISALFILSFMAACVSPPGPLKAPPDAEFTEVPLRRAVYPAFFDEVANKWIRFKAAFLTRSTDYGDLPQKYEEDWIRFYATDSAARRVSSKNFLVPKVKSSMVLGLKTGNIIEIFAFAVPMATRDPKTGQPQKGVLFEVSKIKRTAKGYPSPGPPPQVRQPAKGGR